jgi:nucleoside-diphosphate-sugar epimerase
MRILVLGGTKFIGPYVVRRLSKQGHEVTLFHRGQTEGNLPQVHHIHGDFKSFGSFVDELRRLSAEVVLDMVPFTEEDGHRLLSFKGVARRVVALSSADVYRAFGRFHRTEPGEPDALPLTEESPLREKLSVGGLDYNKTAVERVVRSDSELPATILRLPATYGPSDYNHRLFAYIKRMDDERPAILLDKPTARWRWSRGYVEDVAEAIVLAVTKEQSAGRVYNVAERDAFTEADWIREIAKVTGWEGSVIELPPEQLPENMRNKADLRQHFVVDSSRIRSELGYAEVVPRADALRRTIDWERANPPEVKSEEFDYAEEDKVLSRLEHSYDRNQH